MTDKKLLSWGTATHEGLVRSNNEDALFALGVNNNSLNSYSIGLFIIADGLGGYGTGRLPATVAIDTVAADLMQSAILPLMRHESPDLVPPAIRGGIQKANTEMLNLWDSNKDCKACGSTIDIALIVDEVLFVGHVGNSRIYKISPHEVKPLTEDRYLTGQIKGHYMVQHGDKTNASLPGPPLTLPFPPESFVSPDDLQIDIFAHHLEDNSSILLCTDGLTRHVPETWATVFGNTHELRRHVSPETIATVSRNAATPQQAANDLITAANEAGGLDNTTVIVITYQLVMARRHKDMKNGLDWGWIPKRSEVIRYGEFEYQLDPEPHKHQKMLPRERARKGDTQNGEVHGIPDERVGS